MTHTKISVTYYDDHHNVVDRRSVTMPGHDGDAVVKAIAAIFAIYKEEPDSDCMAFELMNAFNGYQIYNDVDQCESFVCGVLLKAWNEWWNGSEDADLWAHMSRRCTELLAKNRQ